MMKILQICAYGAPYEGNFMKSLYALEATMKEYGYETIYVFTEFAQNHPWVKQLALSHQVYFLPIGRSSFRWKTYSVIKKIFQENKDIQIAHSHFECYDVPLNLIAPKKVKVFWHLHNPISLGTGIKKMLRWLHYSVFSKDVILLSVSEKYRKDIVTLGFKEDDSRTILNGIDLGRIADCSMNDKPFDFLTFGWDFIRKGVDIIIDAYKLLAREGIECSIVINGNDATYSKLCEVFPDGIPSTIKFVSFSEGINEMLSQSRIYIQASRAETFSYSVAEAAYAGLQVITSDIPGLEWSHELPTVHFFETQNAESLACVMKKSMSQVIDNNNLQRTREVIENKYSAACWVQQITNEYFK